ncbi:3-hydroxyacyl-CoA dehydrogenase NAD-binding domain-containing protein [Acidocella aminolytica]|uniref:3-hydroxyacyl-CoA dehydrogenase n=1 Tax=Acidocella aminolytica 101 = DSM 11237 TaxID=1120923 RepID=A0A0D6PLN3_9PROT|nr:3-hydroxyacyl-CoA dehydrogenase NAD-binding domain-containing protein [Acidocella aminolytica]GAN82123.1 3-hydroxyacyl-CoA dehydrogenase [Acidocella aminolytica 101 = DSM 11237]GBQ34590.1 3-hydroxyacyl-CoA dehydrogenase [Acidocella aminolytica 101 = DSM 11237]SHF46166.1 3-hydroxyacyl-CoA dehydrogenase [Acidocella aminolytica 101 = DSM 11237]
MGVLNLAVRDGVLLMTIDHPPVNALSRTVRAGLMEALARLAGDALLRGGVLLGADNIFVGGADIREFGKPASAPTLPEVLAVLEACPKPVVAGLNGAALGGGLELALACDARIALPSAVVGLPEVTLGIIPGAGGTQRLPRLTGLAAAIRLIGTGAKLKADEALRQGILDDIAPDDLPGAAIAWLHGPASAKRPVSARTVPADAPSAVEAAAQAAVKTGKGRPAVRAAIAAVKEAAEVPFAEALQHERHAFETLRASPEAAALRHIFFAEREAVRLPESLRQKPRQLETIAVIGAGTMGAGIALSVLEAGFWLILLDQNAALLAAAGAGLLRQLDERAQAGKISFSSAERARERLILANGWQEIDSADLIIEAVYEDLSVKQEVFRQLDAYAKPHAVLATNTSYLDIDQIAAATSRPRDVLGLHFFSPAHVMKLLEVVQGAQTTPDVLSAGMELGKRLQKLPVMCENRFGFIGNRIYNAYRTHCEFMLEDGAWPEQVDEALEAFGFAMGPFAVMDMSGLDIAWRMRKSRAAGRDPRARHVPVLEALCEQDRFGRKSNIGYYSYDGGKRAKETDQTVRAIIAAASEKRGIRRRDLSPEEIQRRALMTMANEAALLLAEGVAQRASDIDVVLVNGYGFPRWMGGPVHWARGQGRAKLEEGFDIIGEAMGFGFRRGDVDLLL